MDELGSGLDAGGRYEVERAYLALALRGSPIDPARISAVIGLEPTIAVSAREALGPRESFWARQFDMSGTSPLVEQLDAVIARLGEPPGIWRELGNDAKLTLVCSLYPGNWNQGTAVRPDQLQWLADRRITLVIDIHSWSPPRSTTLNTASM